MSTNNNPHNLSNYIVNSKFADNFNGYIVKQDRTGFVVARIVKHDNFQAWHKHSVYWSVDPYFDNKYQSKYPDSKLFDMFNSMRPFKDAKAYALNLPQTNIVASKTAPY